jgi:mRNA interferase HigB
LAFHFLEIRFSIETMLVIGTDLVESYFAARAGHRGSKAARAQYDAWPAIAAAAEWSTPEDVKRSHPKASILKGGRAVFNIKANGCRLIAAVQYREGIVMIRFFGSHADYDEIDAETV